MVGYYQTCYTNSTKGSIHGSISSLLQYSCMIPKIINMTLHTLQRQHQQRAYLHLENFGILCRYAILQAMSDCFVWHSSAPPQRKQFSRAWLALQSTKAT